MKIKLFFVVFILTGFILAAQQNEDLYNLSRQIIYGDTPVGIISKVNNNSLDGLIDYAMKGTDPKTVKQLNDDDSWLLLMLCFIESNRREAKNVNEFLVYLQERSEWLDTQPFNARTGRAAGWVQSYDLMIRSRQLSVGR
jgi:hypothetical protein